MATRAVRAVDAFVIPTWHSVQRQVSAPVRVLEVVSGRVDHRGWSVAGAAAPETAHYVL